MLCVIKIIYIVAWICIANYQIIMSGANRVKKRCNMTDARIYEKMDHSMPIVSIVFNQKWHFIGADTKFSTYTAPR